MSLKLVVVGGALGAFVALATTAAFAADDPDNPYSVIVERNVFHLNPLPPPDPEPEKPKADLPVIKISGFVKIGNESRALFYSVPKDKNEQPTYYNLAQGEKDGILELVKMDSDKGEAEVINSGTHVTLSVKDDTLTTAAAAPPVAGAPTPANASGLPLYTGRGMPPLRGMGRKDMPARANFPGAMGGAPPGPGANNPFSFPLRTPRTPIPQ